MYQLWIRQYSAWRGAGWYWMSVSAAFWGAWMDNADRYWSAPYCPNPWLCQVRPPEARRGPNVVNCAAAVYSRYGVNIAALASANQPGGGYYCCNH